MQKAIGLYFVFSKRFNVLMIMSMVTLILNMTSIVSYAEPGVELEDNKPEMIYTADLRLKIEPACDKFISRSGELGYLGKIMAEEIPTYSNMNQPDNMTEICPNFENLGPDLRKKFIVFFLSQLILVESSCNNLSVAGKHSKRPGTRLPLNRNGDAFGFCQLDSRKNLLNSHGITNHGNKCEGNPVDYYGSDRESEIANVKCCVAIFDEDAGRARSFG